jgi:SAM-dependent methyltransferase
MHAPLAFLAAIGLLAVGCGRASSPSSAPPKPSVALAPAAAEAEHGEVQDGHQHHAHRHHGGHHRFDDAEAWAERFDDPARDDWQRPDEVLRFMGLRADATVVDIGAGTGYFAMRLARAVPQGSVLANDVEPDMVRYLAQRARDEGLGNVVAIQGSASDPGLDQSIDVAFSCNVYHHIDDPVALFGLVRERLSDQGRLVIVDFEPTAPEDAPGPPKAMRVSADAVSQRLREAGFVEVRRDTTTLPYQYILELTPTAAAAP